MAGFFHFHKYNSGLPHIHTCLASFTSINTSLGSLTPHPCMAGFLHFHKYMPGLLHIHINININKGVLIKVKSMTEILAWTCFPPTSSRPCLTKFVKQSVIILIFLASMVYFTFHFDIYNVQKHYTKYCLLLLTNFFNVISF